MITLLNTSILTSHGRFEMKPISLEQARGLVTGQLYVTTASATGELQIRKAEGAAMPSVQSAIGHESTAAILTELLGIPVAVNRIEYQQQVWESAIVFKLKSRPPEGKVLNRVELEAIGFEFYLLYREA